MGCQSSVILGNNLTFTVTTHTTAGVLTDADADAVAYRVYEDETGTAILSGTMTKLDDANTTGHYSEQIACTTANGFEVGKSYNIYISAAVGTNTGGISFGFLVEASLTVTDELTTINDSLTTGLTNTITHKENGTLTNCSAAPTITVTRGDTGAAVAGYPQAMTAVSTGVYNDTFTPPATGIAYNISIAYTQTNGATRTITGTVGAGTSAVTANGFITISEFYQFYDSNLIARLSDDTNTGTADTDVIQIKLNTAAAFMYQYLRGHYYNINTADFTTVDDDYLDQLNADIAMYFLYARRGEVTEMIAERYQRADFELQQIQQGQRQLDGGRTKKSVTYAYTPNVDDDDQGITEQFNIGQAGTGRKIGMP